MVQFSKVTDEEVEEKKKECGIKLQEMNEICRPFADMIEGRAKWNTDVL